MIDYDKEIKKIEPKLLETYKFIYKNNEKKYSE